MIAYFSISSSSLWSELSSSQAFSSKKGYLESATFDMSESMKITMNEASSMILIARKTPISHFLRCHGVY